MSSNLSKVQPMLTLLVERFLSRDDDTVGLLWAITGSTRRFVSFTLEDEFRIKKVPGETRIPAGRYELKLRAAGGMHGRYLKRYPDIHKGMLHFQDVPGFTWVYFHTGNLETHTDGCVLVGLGVDTASGRLLNSDGAYRKLYRLAAAELTQGRAVFVEVRDRG